MMIDLPQALNLHREGRVAEAMRAYQALLDANPTDAETRHAYGVACYQTGDTPRALDLLRQAATALPAKPECAFNLGLALQRAGRMAEAASQFQAAINLNPAWPEAYYNLGNALRDAEPPQASPKAAMAAFRQALRLRPTYAEAEVNLANLLRDEGRTDQAIASYRRVLARNPALPDTWNNLGAALAPTDRGQAEAAYRAALRYRPDFPQALVNLGTLLAPEDSASRAAEAQTLFARAIPLLASAPPGLDTTLTRAEALLGQRRFQDAEAQLRAAATTFPGAWRAALDLSETLLAMGHATESLQALPKTVPTVARPRWHILHGMALRGLHRLAESETTLRAALKAAPASAPITYHLAHTVLQQGRLREGFALFEARIAMLRPAQSTLRAWDGRAPAGRHILVLPEQGLGDTIQFARYLPRLAQAGARVTAIVAAPLVPLLQASFQGVAFLPQGAPHPAADAACLLMSLPHLLGPGTEAALAAPYLHADAHETALSQAWLNSVAPPGLRVGLAWSGNPAYALDHLRSVPPETLAAALAPLAGTGASFIALQPGAKAAAMPGLPLLIPPPQATLAGTAALMTALDLVISVDTVAAHLAGALGKPVWLLNRFNTCWRWQSGTESSLWYGSLRQFRQPQPHNWGTPLGEAAAGLRAMVTPS